MPSANSSVAQAQGLPYDTEDLDFSSDSLEEAVAGDDSDNSKCGHVPLPQVPVMITLQPSADPTVDDRARIQNAIDHVGRQPLRPLLLRDGTTQIQVRGAVLLQAGFYRVSGSLILKNSGVVLRGEGNQANGTILLATGDFQHDFIYLHGLLDPSFQGTPDYLAQHETDKAMRPINKFVVQDETQVADEYIPSGTRRVPVKNIANFHVGEEVVIERRAKDTWIKRLGTDHIPPREDNPSRTKNWYPNEFNLRYVRKIESIEQRSRDEAKSAAQFAFTQGAHVFMAKKKNKNKQGKSWKERVRGHSKLETAKEDAERAQQEAQLQQYAMSPVRMERIDREMEAYLGWHPDTLVVPGQQRVELDNNTTTTTTSDHWWTKPVKEDVNDGEQGEDEEEEEEDVGAEDDPNWMPGYLNIDIPLTMNMDPIYGSGVVYHLERETEIPTDVGIENMALWSEHSPTNREDERHAWFAVTIDHCEHCWAADIRTRYFASGINVAQNSRHVTVQDCAIMNPVSLRSEGGRRYMYMLHGQQGLVKRCFAADARHDFITGSKTLGPNVFVDSEGIRANNEAGPHDRWTTGSLYDNVRSAIINVRNRKWMGAGQGWPGVFHVIYRCAAQHIGTFQSPPGGTNWVIGFRSPAVARAGLKFEGDEATVLTPDPSDYGKIPRSLYWSQLVARLGGNEDVARMVESYVGVQGKNKYPAPLTPRMATAEEIQANEASAWPDWAEPETQEDDGIAVEDGSKVDDAM
ncbi:hypothetical protein BGZ94_004617 [Podila epigama]|nr:hypothetical protein BGZ94_004617 [Podila epigama]